MVALNNSSTMIDFYFYLCVSLCVPSVCMCPQKPKEDIRSPGSRVKAALRQTIWMLGSTLQYSEKAACARNH